jgi:hypothetical protein
MSSDKLNVAIYYSGRVEHTKAKYDENKTHLLDLDKVYNVTHFASLNKSANKEDFIDTFKKDFNIKLDQINIEETVLPSELNKSSMRVEGKLNNMYSMFFHNMKCFQLIDNYQKNHNITFDIVVKYRADIKSTEPLQFPLQIKANTIYIPNSADYGGINDQIAYGNFNSMKEYSNCCLQFYELAKKINRFHPESLLLAHLKQSKLDIERIKFKYKLHKY